MTQSLLEVWDSAEKGQDQTRDLINKEKAFTPWFCLPHMLEAKLSGDADDLIRASTYAPDRARLHEWLSDERSTEEEVAGTFQAAAKPFSLAEFHPPSTLATGGTGALDTKVQVIVGQHFGIPSAIRKELFKKKKAVVIKKEEAPVSKAGKAKEAPSKEIQPAISPSSLVYHSNRGVDIPISVSKEQMALFANEEIKQAQSEKKPEGLISGFKLRPAKELENVQPDASVKNSIEQNELPPSETMAKLLANQGNTQDAIAIFEQLILANPDKNAYFTAQIEKINNLN